MIDATHAATARRLTRLGTLLGALGTAAACATAPTPAPSAGPSPAAAIDRSKPPTLGAPPALTMPPIVRRVLPNGLTLIVVEHHELPLADVVLLVGTGSEADRPQRAGTATLAAAMLREGTTTRSSLEIADQEAFLGVSLGSGSGWDVSRVSLHTPTAQLDSALALFADVVLRPSFPAAELERLRKERLTRLIQLRDVAPAIADRAFASIVFGEAHPYGRSTIGTEETTTAVARDDVHSFYHTYYRPNNATLIVVGDVKPDDIERRVRALFGGWQRAAVPERAKLAAPKPASTAVYLIDKPGAPQSSIRIGGVGVARNTDDYFALLVMNTILGGAFTSRLNTNLRETRGYTYGAGSRFDMRRAEGPFSAGAEVTGTKTDSSLVEFMKELRGIRDTVSAAELEKAKRYLQLQLPGDFETTGDIASQLVPLVLHDLPLDYYNTYVQRIESVTQADVQRVAARYIDPARLNIVIVGDRTSIEAGVRALKLGDVSPRDLSGQPLKP